eukprot:9840040-Alexandrium_andersonii.AAC.1
MAARVTTRRSTDDSRRVTKRCLPETAVPKGESAQPLFFLWTNQQGQYFHVLNHCARMQQCEKKVPRGVAPSGRS